MFGPRGLLAVFPSLLSFYERIGMMMNTHQRRHTNTHIVRNGQRSVSHTPGYCGHAHDVTVTLALQLPLHHPLGNLLHAEPPGIDSIIWTFNPDKGTVFGSTIVLYYYYCSIYLLLSFLCLVEKSHWFCSIKLFLFVF